MLRVIEAIKPTYVIGENVTGILDMAFDQVCVDLENKNYEVQSVIIPACSLNAPHKRDRVWFLAHSNSSTNVAKSSEIREEEEVQGVDRKALGSWLSRGTDSSQIFIDNPWTNFPTQSPICRGDDGIPYRMDRIKSLGNAVVPQIVEIIGKAIVAIENSNLNNI